MLHTREMDECKSIIYNIFFFLSIPDTRVKSKPDLSKHFTHKKKACPTAFIKMLNNRREVDFFSFVFIFKFSWAEVYVDEIWVKVVATAEGVGGGRGWKISHQE